MFFSWGHLPLQSYWSRSCGHGLHCSHELMWEQHYALDQLCAGRFVRRIRELWGGLIDSRTLLQCTEQYVRFDILFDPFWRISSLGYDEYGTALNRTLTLTLTAQAAAALFVQRKTRLITFVTFIFSRVNYSFIFLVPGTCVLVRISEIISSLTAAALHYVRYFRRAILETLRVRTDWQYFRVRCCSLMLPVLLAVCHRSILPTLRVSILAVFRILYVCTAWTPCKSGLDAADRCTVGTPSNLGGYCGRNIIHRYALRTLLLLPLWMGSTLTGSTLILRALAALKYNRYSLNAPTQYTPSMKYHETSIWDDFGGQ